MNSGEETYTARKVNVIIGHITTPIMAEVLDKTISILTSHNILVVPCAKAEENHEAWYTLLFFPHNAVQSTEDKYCTITIFDEFRFIYFPPTFEASRVGRYKTHPKIEVNENST